MSQAEATPELILASASPRRRELLEARGLTILVRPAVSLGLTLGAATDGAGDWLFGGCAEAAMGWSAAGVSLSAIAIELSDLAGATVRSGGSDGPAGDRGGAAHPVVASASAAHNIARATRRRPE